METRFVNKSSLSSIDRGDILAILASDLHLSERPPVSRAEKGVDWIAAQARVLEEIGEVSLKCNNAPILMAGDVFHKWNTPVSTINFAIGRMPFMFTVCGQHDLPYHRYEDMHRSAYWTLELAGKIAHLHPGQPVCPRNSPLRLWGFPWGYPPQPLTEPKEAGRLDVALVHAYIWDAPENAYPGADPGRMVTHYRPGLAGYEAAVFGDNHRGFTRNRQGASDVTIHNNGGLMRRRADEREYRPQLGLLHRSGRVTPYRLDVSQDRWATPDVLRDLVALEGARPEATQFLEDLESLGDTVVDFVDAVRVYLRRGGVSDAVRKRILDCLGDGA